ncbi:MAG: hypothetical protein E4G96_03385 [Chrysiogenales bacterium]|nr:MAG: hypothetical protein E4G96_03385 [Chrysiogenales bacterium]
MRFSLLLFGLMILMKRKAKKNAEFRQKLREKDYTLVIKTKDGKRGRVFIFRNGEIESRKGDDPGADISLVWRDASTGFRVMRGGRTKVFMAALQDGSLKILGDGGLSLVFIGVVKEMFKKPKK